jgi:anti-anti-sigma regulatory factor
VHDDVVVSVIGDLDPASAGVLLELVEAAIGTPGTNRGVEVDLRRVRACSNSGVRALTSCAQLGARLHDGLHFRVGISPEAVDHGPDNSTTMER